MMKKTVLAAALLCAAMTTGCVEKYAIRDIVQGAPPATLLVTNAPDGARILVDGREVGVVGQVPAISLTVGRHEVAIHLGGRTLHSQAVYVSAGAGVEVRVP